MNQPRKTSFLRGAPRRTGRPHVTGSILVASLWMVASAGAAPIVTGLHRTGESVTRSGFARAPVKNVDPFWQVVALPETSGLKPYAAGVLSGRGPSFAVPAPWYHGTDGFNGAGWIGPRSETTLSLYSWSVGPRSDYTVIYATTFTASVAGSVDFDLAATADNALSFFVNGKISGSDTLMPTIVGGTQIDVEQQSLSELHAFRGRADVHAGENVLYAVVRDRYVLDAKTNVGGYGRTGLLVAFVPEPGGLTSLALAAACLPIVTWGRRATRRSRTGPGRTPEE